MGRKLIDLTGQKFGRWTVIKRVQNKGKQPYWLCQCNCENHTLKEVKGASLRNGQSKSCGCLQKQHLQNDLTNQRFGKLIAIQPTSERSGTQVVWKCKCDCGNITYVGAGNLKNGHTLSCGCLRKENNNTFKNLVGQEFGLLTVLEATEKRYFTNIIWKCQCSCQNKTICYVPSNRLLMGKTKSCGCIEKSTGEKIIQKLLKENNIPFEKQKKFTSCRDKLPLPFDFYINNQYLVEFDGIQHFEPIEFFEQTQTFEILKKHDIIKNNWCKDNNIPLIRIPYTHLQNLKIQDLLLKTSNFLI